MHHQPIPEGNMDSYGDSTALAAAYLIAALTWFIFAVVFYVLGSLFLMKIFEKAGVEGKWRAWVPFYNVMIFLKLGDLSPWLAFGFLLTWVPFLGWLVGIAMAVLMVLAAWRVGLKLQKSGAWVVLYIFLSIVWLGINAFDKSRWNPNIVPASWAGNGFLADRTVWQGIPVQPSAQAAPGYGAPQGYQPPAAQGYAPPQPGYGQPTAPQAPAAPQAPTFQPPAAPPAPAAPQPPVTPPAPPAPPATPSADPDAPQTGEQPPA
jgi:hypothetical protein